jgi:Uma2 family endonuclease
MVLQSQIEVDYPETDGQPMGETDVHRCWMIRILDLLTHRYRGQHVYVSGDLLVYYEEGNPTKFVVPDAMVIKDCDPRPRRVFKIWEENRTPAAVIETTSRGTRREDSMFKPRLYHQLGIPEYFLYDPTGDYLKPALQGYRLTGSGYERIEPDAAQRLVSNELGLWLQLDQGDLVMSDTNSGKRILTEAESERAAREAAEAELERVRDELRRRGLSS